MNDTAPTKTTKVSENEISDSSLPIGKQVSIRVSPNTYFVALFLATFFSGLLFYLEFDFAGVALFGLCWLFLPFLSFTDRLVFDGKRLERTGVLPKAWANLNNSRKRLKISDIEQVDTQALRTMKRGGKVRYRYRTAIRGKGTAFAFASGGEDYRTMIRAILPLLPDNVLDNRSLELRDYISEPAEIQTKAALSKIPPADVLENSFADIHQKNKRPQPAINEDSGQDENEKAKSLRQLANELRLSGSLLQALEAFRRAVLLKPKDAWLLFEFARCLQSFAGSERDQKLERKAVAMMRLAEMRAGNDGDLLARLGESYFQVGEWRRAGIVFEKAVEAVGESFRSVRGLAEIALREGKIAHVIHNFSTANRLAETPALRRWTKGEVEYFSRLNDDDDYMEMEVSRVNLVDSLERSKSTALRAAFIAFPLIAVGIVFEDSLVTNIGWAISTVALVIWTGMILTAKMLSPRIPPELLEED